MFRYFKGIVPAAFVVAGLAAGMPSYAAQVGLSKVAPAAQVGLSKVAPAAQVGLSTVAPAAQVGRRDRKSVV